MSQNNQTETSGVKFGHDTNPITPYELATLAGQICPELCYQKPSEAITAAVKLLEAGELEIKGIEVRARAQAEDDSGTWEKKEEERLANLRIPYEQGVKFITGAGRWSGDYGALNWFKRFLQWKAAKQEKTPGGIEARVEAWLISYREKGFTGLQCKKLQDDFSHWRNKGKQGRVRKKSRDGRLREQRQEKAKKAADAAWKELIGPRQRTKPELEFVADTDLVQAEAVRGCKTPVRSGETLIRGTDTPEL
jgi:hypothetical protein